MQLTDEQISKMKEYELDIFTSFLSVCEKLKLQYYILGGTMLGAVRHKGFIPWDDDIDVAMPRADYEIFLKEGQALLPSNLFIQSVYSDAGYLMCFAKIRNSDTTFLECTVRNRKMNHGIFIDVFPLDYYPEDEKQKKVFEFKKKLYNLRISCEFDSALKQTMKQRIAKCVLKVMYPSARSVLLKRDRLYKSVSKSELLVNHGGAWGHKEIVPASWYGAGSRIWFENLEVLAPTDYNSWLTQVYGDYMQLPPVEKRIGHHFVDVVDFEKSYTKYIGE